MAFACVTPVGKPNPGVFCFSWMNSTPPLSECLKVPLPISALTDKDLADLRSVLDIADMVNLSFVRTPEDVTRLLDELDVLGADELGVVLKIETRAAFEHLPQLLLTAMRRRKVGVMIARGDLAVDLETGAAVAEIAAAPGH